MEYRRTILLWPFSLVYGLLTAIRNFLYNSGLLKSYEFNLPVICVGNLAVGGTGKTPHTEYLAALLQKEFNVAVLSRGYKRLSRGFRFADSSGTSADIGDEPLQIAGKFPGITVAVDGNRVRGIRTILEEKPSTGVIILDDGYQHRRIKPGFSILLTACDRLMINDHLLPYGNLRERARNMNRADIILITKCPPGISPVQRRIIVKDVNKWPYQNLYFTTVVYGRPVRIFDAEGRENDIFDETDPKKISLLLVTGIADPRPLAKHLEDKTGELVHLSFGDHHAFTPTDIIKIKEAWKTLKGEKRYIITTEKDAVRLREFTNIADEIRSSSYYLPIEIDFLNDDREEFNNLITDYVRKNKRNNRVSPVKRIH
ncbi:MAG: tetraacyldisaccharide 4'-kinase [Bacteroidales bacterium]|jgi:tetraacyldisaccharide 4'-kinase|nr:tetraacyldisaccharide 4'-kinase [Bacteroidales bacterium]